MTIHTSQPKPFQLTPNPSDLDIQLQTLVDSYSIGAVGESLAHQYGKTRVIAAALGQRPNAVSCVSIQHSTAPKPPYSHQAEAHQPWYRDELSEIVEQLTAMSDRLERQALLSSTAAQRAILLHSAIGAIGIAINCIQFHRHQASSTTQLLEDQ